jgi:LysM repeat protein
MLPSMNMADPDPASMPAEAPPGPSQTSLDDLAPQTRPGLAAEIEDVATPTGCPFLLAEGGGWRLDMPSRDHRCAAVSPPAPLSLEKQSRLCLAAAHVGCATYLASMSARDSRLGSPSAVRTTRWGLARTTTVIEDAGGLRSRLLGLLLDRRRWPAIPAVILVTTLLVLAFSGLRGGSATPVATASPTRPAVSAAPSKAPTQAPAGSEAPSAAPSDAPTAPPSSNPTATPATTSGPTETFRTYKVKSGDTLSAIASDFGTTSRAIADLNGIKVSATLRVGQILKIPNPAP